GVRDDRLPAAEDPVHQRGLADVRPADHGHDRGGLLRVPVRLDAGPLRAHLVHAPAFLLSARVTIWLMTSSRPRAVVSISTASAALAVCGASDRSRCACSARVTATVTAG